MACCHCGVLDAYGQQHHGAGRAGLKWKGKEIDGNRSRQNLVNGSLWQIEELSTLFHMSPHAVVSCCCPCLSFSFQPRYAKGYAH